MKDEHWDLIASVAGFESIEDLLKDRYTRQEWSIERIANELGVHRATVKRLMDQFGIPLRDRASLVITREEAINLSTGEIARRYSVTMSTAWRAKKKAKEDSDADATRS